MWFSKFLYNSGDIILIGKRKEDMMIAFNRLKEIGGGIILTEYGQVIGELPLTLQGLMSDKWFLN